MTDRTSPNDASAPLDPNAPDTFAFRKDMAALETETDPHGAMLVATAEPDPDAPLGPLAQTDPMLDDAMAQYRHDFGIDPDDYFLF